MRQVLVTGAAGFIGSHLAESLLKQDIRVRAVDCLTGTYSRGQKLDNIRRALQHVDFEFLEVDLRAADANALMEDVSAVFHLAAIPGVRPSWSSAFNDYVSHNILGTQRLLEAARTADIQRFVYSSSSSVYGNAAVYPTQESDLPSPHSPYGVTKLAGEQLCTAYAGNFGIPIVSLRYFTVFGPRQRPDMAMHRLMEAALGRGTFPMFGTGEQERDFTYVDDVVAANIAALSAELAPGSVVNIAGGSSASLNDVIDTISTIAGTEIPIVRTSTQPGDVHRTGGATEIAREVLDWSPAVGLTDGLHRQFDWHRSRTLD